MKFPKGARVRVSGDTVGLARICLTPNMAGRTGTSDGLDQDGDLRVVFDDGGAAYFPPDGGGLLELILSETDAATVSARVGGVTFTLGSCFGDDAEATVPCDYCDYGNGPTGIGRLGDTRCPVCSDTKVMKVRDSG